MCCCWVFARRASTGRDRLEETKKVWEKVQKIVESNGNVRSKQTDIRGEIMKVWEWIGPDFV